MRICPIFCAKITPFTLKMEMHHLPCFLPISNPNTNVYYISIYNVKYQPKTLDCSHILRISNKPLLAEICCFTDGTTHYLCSHSMHSNTSRTLWLCVFKYLYKYQWNKRRNNYCQLIDDCKHWEPFNCFSTILSAETIWMVWHGGITDEDIFPFSFFFFLNNNDSVTLTVQTLYMH